jgi:hypothetical protein
MVFRNILELITRAPEGEGDAGTAGADDQKDAGAAGDGGAGEGGDAGAQQGDAKAAVGAAPEWPADGFPDDWADRMLKSSGLNDDAAEKAKKFFERRKSPADVLKSALSADSRISELSEDLKGRLKPLTGKDDKPEDVAAWNKAMGIPDAPDKYQIWEDTKAPWAPEEKAMIEGVLPLFHKEGLGQKGVDAALQVFRKVQDDSLRQMKVAAMQVADTTTENLRIDYGKNYDAQIEMANRVAGEVFNKFLPKDTNLHSILSLPLSTGGTVGDYEPFVRGMIELGKVFGDHGALETGMSDPKSLESRRAEIHQMQMKDPKAYAAAQAELVQITTALKRQGKVK